METLKNNDLENSKLLDLIDSTLQKQIDSYNLELLIQCERQGEIQEKTLEKLHEIKAIKNQITNSDSSENMASIISHQALQATTV